jgi:hypothetical protein
MDFALFCSFCFCILFVANDVRGHTGTKELDAVKARIIQVIFIESKYICLTNVDTAEC